MMDDLARPMASLYTSCCHMLRFIDAPKFLTIVFAAEVRTNTCAILRTHHFCVRTLINNYRIPKYFVTLAISQIMSWVSMFSASKIVVKNFLCSQRLVYDVGLSLTKIQFDCIRKRVHFACVSTG